MHGRWNAWLQAPHTTGASSPGNLASGGQPSKAVRQMPQTSSPAFQVHDATACQDTMRTSSLPPPAGAELAGSGSAAAWEAAPPPCCNMLAVWRDAARKCSLPQREPGSGRSTKEQSTRGGWTFGATSCHVRPTVRASSRDDRPLTHLPIFTCIAICSQCGRCRVAPCRGGPGQARRSCASEGPLFPLFLGLAVWPHSQPEQLPRAALSLSMCLVRAQLVL